MNQLHCSYFQKTENMMSCRYLDHFCFRFRTFYFQGLTAVPFWQPFTFIKLCYISVSVKVSVVITNIALQQPPWKDYLYCQVVFCFCVAEIIIIQQMNQGITCVIRFHLPVNQQKQKDWKADDASSPCKRLRYLAPARGIRGLRGVKLHRFHSQPGEFAKSLKNLFELLQCQRASY